MSAHESLPSFTITLFFSSSVRWTHVLGSFGDDLEARNNSNNVPRRHRRKQVEDNINQKTPFRFHLHTRYSQDARAVVSAILLLRLLLPSRSCMRGCFSAVYVYSCVCTMLRVCERVRVCLCVRLCLCARAALFERARRNLRQMWYSSGTQTPPTPGASSARPSAGGSSPERFRGPGKRGLRAEITRQRDGAIQGLSQGETKCIEKSERGDTDRGPG